jgi:hypothetical protein
VKRPEHLISVGLLAAVVAGSGSAVALWRAREFRALDWPTGAAILHPVWLGLGEVLGAFAVVVGAAALSGVAIRHSGSSALAAFGVILLGLGAIGAVGVVALDIGLIRAAKGGVLDAIFFGQRWNWWDALAWLLLTVGGLVGLLLFGIGIARGNRALRLPGASLAGSAILIFLFPRLGIACLAVVFVWMAVGISRSGASLHPRSTAFSWPNPPAHDR